ncbi:MAG: EF-hand domain-containing protein [archaeon]|nr:EF-hand domain-containing protein [archaeon]
MSFVDEGENLEDDKLAECKYIFGIYDENKDGLVNINETKEILRTTGVYPTNSEMNYLMSQVNPSGKGQLNLDQILEMLNIYFENNTETEESMINSFKVFDKDGRGTIKVEEFKHAILAFEDDITETRLKDMMKIADPDKKGVIKYKEFVHKMLQV